MAAANETRREWVKSLLQRKTAPKAALRFAVETMAADPRALSRWLSGRPNTTLVPRDAIPGQGQALLPSPAGPLGFVISYEAFFADCVREAVTSRGRSCSSPPTPPSHRGGPRH